MPKCKKCEEGELVIQESGFFQCDNTHCSCEVAPENLQA